MRSEKDKIYDRVKELVEGHEMSKEALTAKLTELIFQGYEMNFRVGMMIGDLELNVNECKPPVCENWEQAMMDLDIDPLSPGD